MPCGMGRGAARGVARPWDRDRGGPSPGLRPSVASARPPTKRAAQPRGERPESWEERRPRRAYNSRAAPDYEEGRSEVPSHPHHVAIEALSLIDDVAERICRTGRTSIHRRGRRRPYSRRHHDRPGSIRRTCGDPRRDACHGPRRAARRERRGGRPEAPRDRRASGPGDERRRCRCRGRVRTRWIPAEGGSAGVPLPSTPRSRSAPLRGLSHPRIYVECRTDRLLRSAVSDLPPSRWR